MALNQEVWVKDVVANLFPENSFASQSVDDSDYVSNKTVHIPNAGAPPSVVKNRAFQAGGATPTSATGWSADPTNTSGSKILASTSNYSTWSTGGGGFMIQYKFSTGTSTPDTTAPTFTSSSSFSAADT